jgi:hypothetical protein
MCSDCDVPLVRHLDSDSPDALVPLTREKSFELVADILDRLEKEDVPYVVQAGTALHLLDGAWVDGTKPRDWEARIWVPRSAHLSAAGIVEDVMGKWRRGREIIERYRHSID